MKVLVTCFLFVFTQCVSAQIKWQRSYPLSSVVDGYSLVIENDSVTYAVIENRRDYATVPVISTAEIRIIDGEGSIKWQSGVLVDRTISALIKVGKDFILIGEGPSAKVYALKVSGTSGAVIWDKYIGDFLNGFTSIVPSRVESGNYDVFLVVAPYPNTSRSLPFLMTLRSDDGVIVRTKKLAETPLGNYILDKPIQLPGTQYAIQMVAEDDTTVLGSVFSKTFLKVFSAYGDLISVHDVLGCNGFIGGSFYQEGLGVISHRGDSLTILKSGITTILPDLTAARYKRLFPGYAILHSKTNGEFLEILDFARTFPQTSSLDGAVKILRKKIDGSGKVQVLSEITLQPQLKDSEIVIQSAVPTLDGGYILAGSIRKITEFNSRSFIMRIGPSGDVASAGGKIKIFPNPANGYCFVKTESMTLPESLRVYDASGKLLRKEIVTTTTQNVSLEGLPKGILFCAVGTTTAKLLHF